MMISKTDRMMCGTCAYWTGRREPIFDKKGIPKVRIDDRFASCENEGSRFCGAVREHSAKCGKYSKWTEIL